MAPHSSPTLADGLLRESLEGLRQSTDITESVLDSGPNATAADAMVELRRGGRSALFTVLVKPNLRAAHLAILRELRAELNASGANVRPLVVTDHVSAPLAQQLRAAGLSFVDAAGNAFLETGEWFVLITGQSRRAPPPKERPLSPSIWQVAYVLLRHPVAQTGTVRALAEHAGVSPGAAQGAIDALEARGWLATLGRRGQPVTDPEALWRAWELGYVDRLGPKLHLTQAVAPASGTLQQWHQAVGGHLGPDTGLLGGELAAQVLGTDLVAVTATLHVSRWDAAVMCTLRILPAEVGPITVRRTFGDSTTTRPIPGSPIHCSCEPSCWPSTTSGWMLRGRPSRRSCNSGGATNGERRDPSGPRGHSRRRGRSGTSRIARGA